MLEKIKFEPGTIRRYTKYNIAMLRLVGLWTNTDSFFGSKLYCLYSATVNILFIALFNTSIIVYVLKNLKEFELVAASAHIALVFVMPNIKACVFIKNYRLVKELLKQLDQEEFQPKNLRQKHRTHSFLKVIIIVLYLYLFITAVLVCLWLISPLVLYDGKEKKLPFPAWYPYHWRKPLLYKLTYVHQGISSTYLPLVNLNLDLCSFGLTVYVGVQCDILSDTLRNIFEFTKERMNVCGLRDFGRVNNENDLEEKLIVEVNNTLMLCVDHHRKILRFAEGTNKFLNILIFSQFASSLLATCLTLFMLTIVSPMSAEFLTVAFFQMAVFVELMVYCYFGHEVMSKSQHISNALYDSPWVDCPLVFKKNVLFFMLRTQRPIRVLALNFFELSLNTFTSIIRISWSVFAMIRQVVNKA